MFNPPVCSHVGVLLCCYSIVRWRLGGQGEGVVSGVEPRVTIPPVITERVSAVVKTIRGLIYLVINIPLCCLKINHTGTYGGSRVSHNYCILLYFHRWNEHGCRDYGSCVVSS